MLQPLLFVAFIVIANSEHTGYGPKVTATRGDVWPKPFLQISSGDYFEVDPENFEFSVVNEDCDMLQDAIDRYTKIIKQTTKSLVRADDTDVQETVSQFVVNLTNSCEDIPNSRMDESYHLCNGSYLEAASIWGILRGLESLSQLLVPMPNGMLRLTDTEIYDEPRFKHRGFMLDASKHFISVANILNILDGISYNKFNIFHWHISDDPAFPFIGETYPELGQKGAFSPSQTYSVDDVKNVVEYARLRGIRVIPEFDTPSHTSSWGLSHPELLTQCKDGTLGPIDPRNEYTYDFLYNFYSEITGLFPDESINLGGDEVDPICWILSPDFQDSLNENGKTISDMTTMYFERLSYNVSQMNRIPTLWQGAISSNPGMRLPEGTMVQTWILGAIVVPELTALGYPVINSDGFYLVSADSWKKLYQNEPTNFIGTKKQKKLIVGSETCLWTEEVNDNDVISETFPKVLAVAERLWSQKSQLNVNKAVPRIEEQNCRMQLRGIKSAVANGYGMC